MQITNLSSPNRISILNGLIGCRDSGIGFPGGYLIPSQSPSSPSISLAWPKAFNNQLYLPVCLSRAWLNWLIGGGTFNLVWRTAFCLWRRMYFGQRTNRLKSLLGWISCPIPKFRGRFSNKGFTTLFCSGFLTASGAAATFFPFFFP